MGVGGHGGDSVPHHTLQYLPAETRGMVEPRFNSHTCARPETLRGLSLCEDAGVGSSQKPFRLSHQNRMRVKVSSFLLLCIFPEKSVFIMKEEELLPSFSEEGFLFQDKLSSKAG